MCDKTMYPHLAQAIKPLQDGLERWQGIREEQLRSLSRSMWDKIVAENGRMFLNKDSKEFHV